MQRRDGVKRVKAGGDALNLDGEMRKSSARKNGNHGPSGNSIVARAGGRASSAPIACLRVIGVARSS